MGLNTPNQFQWCRSSRRNANIAVNDAHRIQMASVICRVVILSPGLAPPRDALGNLCLRCSQGALHVKLVHEMATVSHTGVISARVNPPPRSLENAHRCQILARLLFDAKECLFYHGRCLHRDCPADGSRTRQVGRLGSRPEPYFRSYDILLSVSNSAPFRRF